jgi:hypothetical protein
MGRSHSRWRKATLGLVLVLSLAGIAGGWAYVHRGQSPYGGNAILVLQPYKEANTWAFDDPQVGLKREPFVAGIPEILDRLTKDIPDAPRGFRLLFSTTPFPGHQIELTWLRAETAGNWYRCEEYQTEGWLCPALGRYLPTPPKKLYAKAEPLH